VVDCAPRAQYVDRKVEILGFEARTAAFGRQSARPTRDWTPNAALSRRYARHARNGAGSGETRRGERIGHPCNHRRMREVEEDEHESAYELLQRGSALLKQRHFAQAATVLERADRAEPRKASILEALGRAYYNSGQHERSRETFEQLLEVDPSAHYAHYALGQSYKQLGRVKEARTHLKLAVALAPSSPLYQGALQRLGSPPREES
jgi:tetratricopeptide (TPR) repeat protein